MDIAKILKGSFLNIGFQIFPVLCAIIMVPITINLYGKEQFALFTLAITQIVLFNYLNFGVAQSANKELSRLKPSERLQINQVFWSGFLIMCAVGFFLTLVFSLLGTSIISLLVSKSPELFDLAKEMIVSVGLFSPLFLIIIYLRSCLEAKLAFHISASNRALLNSIIFLSPAISSFFNFGIQFSISIIIFAHIFSCVFLALHLRKKLTLQSPSINYDIIKILTKSGYWMTIVSIASLIFYYIDRYMLGAIHGLEQVSYYVAAYDVITRASILYGSAIAAFFPAFSYWFKHQQWHELREAFRLIFGGIWVVMGLITGFAIIFAYDFIAIWINDDFAENSSLLLQILALGVLFNAIGIAPLRCLYAINREKVVAKYYILQSILYAPVLFFAITLYGPEGAAYAYCIRAIFEFFILFALLLKNEENLKNLIETSKRGKLVFFVIIGWISLSIGLQAIEDFSIRIILSIVIFSTIIGLNYKTLFQLERFKKISQYNKDLKL